MNNSKLMIFAAWLALGVSCQSGHNHSEARQHDAHEEAAAHEAHADSHDPHAAEKHAHAAEIVISPEKAEAAGIVVTHVSPDSFCGVVKVGGEIMEASGDEAAIVAAASGTVSLLQPLTEGTRVAEGRPLFSISGKNMQGGDPLELARVAYETAERELARVTALLDDHIVTQKEYNAAKAEYDNARIAYSAISRGTEATTKASSPIAGYIKSCAVKEGDYVTAGQPLAVVTQSRRLYLKADVPERHYGELANLSSAHFKTAYSDEVHDIKAMGGRLVACGKSAGGTSPYIPVTFEFNNTGSIVPGSFAEVYLLTRERNNVISLPATAITEEQGVNFVYVREDSHCYVRREVKLGESDGMRVEILKGVNAGEQVVTQGAIHVKLASASNIIPAHTHNH